MSPKLLVITVNYCCAEAILEGMDTLVEQLRAVGNATFCIVDNKSPDDSLAILEAAIREQGCADIVKVIASDTNGGFGAGNNVAINAALNEDTPPDYFYFLNPDAVPGPGAIAAFLGFMQSHPDAGAAGGVLCDDDGALQTSFFRFPSFWSEIEHAISLGFVRKLLKGYTLALDTPTTATKIDWVTGASFIARRSALEKAGPFDETFFLYFEEVELCHRIHKAGFHIYALPDVMTQHTGSVTTGMDTDAKRTPEYWFASRNHMFAKTRLAGHPVLLNLAVSAGLAVRRLHQGLRGRPMTPPAFLRDFAKHIFTRPSGAHKSSDMR